MICGKSKVLFKDRWYPIALLGMSKDECVGQAILSVDPQMKSFSYQVVIDVLEVNCFGRDCYEIRTVMSKIIALEDQELYVSERGTVAMKAKALSKGRKLLCFEKGRLVTRAIEGIARAKEVLLYGIRMKGAYVANGFVIKGIHVASDFVAKEA